MAGTSTDTVNQCSWQSNFAYSVFISVLYACTAPLISSSSITIARFYRKCGYTMAEAEEAAAVRDRLFLNSFGLVVGYVVALLTNPQQSTPVTFP